MENVLENLKEAKSVFLLKSERNVQTIIGGEKLTISEGDNLSFIVSKINPISESVVGIFYCGKDTRVLECDMPVFKELISELMILTAKTK